MLMMTVAIVSVSHAGMNVAPMVLLKRTGPHVKAAKPTMTIVINMRRRGEDFAAADPCPASEAFCP